MKRRTPMKRTPFKRKKAHSTTSLKQTENAPQNQAQSHASKALAAIINVVKNKPKTATSAPALTPVFRGSFPKSQPVRSAAYRRVVASLPCVICGVPGYSQAAHGSGVGTAVCKWPKGLPYPHDGETGSSAYGASGDSYQFRSEDAQ